MPLSISPVEDDEVPVVADLICESTIHDGIREYIAATWPGMNTPAGRADARSRFQSMKRDLTEGSHFLKVIDKATGDIVACTLCLYYSVPPPTLPGPSEDTTESEARAYAQHLSSERRKLLLNMFAGLSCPVVEILAFFVHPTSQRQGIGKFLMQHVTALQKETPLVLIANPNARGFYEKCGFEVQEDKALPLPKKWQSKPPSHLTSMRYAGVGK